jgi:hypothetical protein
MHHCRGCRGKRAGTAPQFCGPEVSGGVNGQDRYRIHTGMPRQEDNKIGIDTGINARRMDKSTTDLKKIIISFLANGW